MIAFVHVINDYYITPQMMKVCDERYGLGHKPGFIYVVYKFFLTENFRVILRKFLYPQLPCTGVGRGNFIWVLSERFL